MERCPTYKLQYNPSNEYDQEPTNAHLAAIANTNVNNVKEF